MALDGIFLSKIKSEIEHIVIGARVDKIVQPRKEEIVLSFRGREGVKRLYICPSANAPRVHFISESPAAPQTVPMFCMLLRKHLSGAILTEVTQRGTDRVLELLFSASNEIGDRVKRRLIIEIMGKCSNIILVGEDNVIIDAIKRVPVTVSAIRQILPKLPYLPPSAQNKLSLISAGVDEMLAAVLEKRNNLLSKAVISCIEGISPVVSREVAYRATGYDDFVYSIDGDGIERLKAALALLKEYATEDRELFLLFDRNKRPKDISFFPVRQYEGEYTSQSFASPSELLECFYRERDEQNRMNARGRELLRLTNGLIDRARRKIANQTAELEECREKDSWKLFGELITNNAYSLEKGRSAYIVENYYDEMNPMTIPADPALTPMENANFYYRKYRKARTAEGILTELIAAKKDELSYLETVVDEIDRAESDNEILSIRAELYEGGYLKKGSTRKKLQAKELPPLKFMTDDGYSVLVGRNNVQNDKLSLKTAGGNDMWLHTQLFPGSHVIIAAKDGKVSDLAIEQAAVIAAYYSKARGGSLVPVDYTPVKLLKKPRGAKPGKVIYHEYYTVIVDPDEALVRRLKLS